MTAIPEPSESDFEFLEKLQLRYYASEFTLFRWEGSPLKGKAVLVDLQSAIRLLAHVTQQRDEMREWVKANPQLIEIERAVKEQTGHDINAFKPGSSYLLACSRVGALEGK